MKRKKMVLTSLAETERSVVCENTAIYFIIACCLSFMACFLVVRLVGL